MKFKTVVLGGGLLLFTTIGLLGWMKKQKRVEKTPLEEMTFLETKKVEAPPSFINQPITLAHENAPPEVDLMGSLFDPAGHKLPIVETISYSSKAPWLKGRPAWIADYASYHHTSRHFIARSLNGKEDYFTQNVANGDRFNVFRNDKNFEFYLVIDTSRCKMWFYYLDHDLQERVLLKVYDVGLGRFEEKKGSGLLTPIGKYSLGDKIAVYRPGSMGHFNNQQVEMVRVFGTRWIPFEKELECCTAPAKGLGIHGSPWIEEGGALLEDPNGVGNYTSDGCIRMRQKDMEELFSIVITKQTTVDLVRDFYEAKPLYPEKKY